MRKHFHEFWDVWVGVSSGLASLVLAYIGAVLDTPGKAIGCWVAGYVCLGISTFIVLRRMHLRLKELEAGGITLELRRAAHEKLKLLTPAEIRGVRSVLVGVRLTGDQLRNELPGIDLVSINNRSSFLVVEKVLVDIGHFTDSWSVHPDWKAPLVSLLVTPRPKFFWAKWWRRIRCLALDLKCGRKPRHHRRNERIRVSPSASSARYTGTMPSVSCS